MADVDMMAVLPSFYSAKSTVCVCALLTILIWLLVREREGKVRGGESAGDVGVVGGTTSISGSYIPTPYIYIYTWQSNPVQWLADLTASYPMLDELVRHTFTHRPGGKIVFFFSKKKKQKKTFDLIDCYYVHI
jgi:hypothetical protein